MTLRGRDFLSVSDLDREELLGVLELAARIKAGGWREQALAGKHVAMLFQKPSNRTRVSFEVGIARLGGQSVALGENDVQLGERESVPDAARVLERYVDLVVARLKRHADLLELAAWSGVPVVSLEGVRLVFVGDGNNVVTSLAHAQARLGFPFTVVTPPGYEPPAEVRAAAPEMKVSNDLAAVTGADAVYTDVWTSMGFESEREERRKAFARYRVDSELLRRAPDAIFLHCLPAHRGEEVTDEVIDGPRSAVWDQAENRLHAQMALLALVV
ncbi:MAG: ornithine carbamoyltransferase [Chloroflexi bacterium]|nr:MAG: ornithine carbamoyltransferase [Chloroflexota bacterium]